MIYGQYPEIFKTNLINEKQKKLEEITSSYLFKDLFEFQHLKKAPLLEQLLQLLSLQIGHEVSYQELSHKLGVDQITVQKYIYLLESAFVIFRLPAFSRNIRKEITKSRKIYFYDLGIRNTLIQNWNPLHIRNDVGGLWENLCIIERIKFLHYKSKFVNHYFWRTYDQKEIDLIEESKGALRTYEFKWSERTKARFPKIFQKNYPQSSFEVISPKNVEGFVR
jgi:predicted AAA+ superfamily ATPase